MGLDNIPRAYPCREEGTAYFMPARTPDEEDKVVDCNATQLSGGCPWQRSELAEMRGGVHGIFGTDCWYRGKVGTWMLDTIGRDDVPNNGFYGPTNEGLDSEECIELAEYMAERAELYSQLKAVEIADETDDEAKRTEWHEHAVHEYRYAVAYLRWAAEHCGGLDAWW